MKHGRFVLMILALVCMCSNLLLASTLTVTAPTGTVRGGPGKAYAIIGKVTRTEQYEVMEERGGWYRIRMEQGTEGWLSGNAGVLNQERSINVSSSRRFDTAQRRFALLVGNAAYADSPLRNPNNDATEMAALLRQFGFEVTVLRDADKRTMDNAIRRFTASAPKGSVGLFYFSGHGIQIAGENYLIPIGEVYSQPSDVEHGAVKANWVLARMEDAGMDVKLIILDACRNNPFGRSWTRGAGGGLAPMEAVRGSLIAYATSPGKTAADGTGRNSPYTTHLLQQIPTLGQPVETMFKKVRVGVEQETNRKQTPWEASSLTGDFYFGGQAAVQPVRKEEPLRKDEPLQLGGLSILGRVSGAEVWVGADKIGETRAGGALTWENLKPGRYRLKARKPGYEPWEQEVTVVANQRKEVVIDIKPLLAPPSARPEPVKPREEAQPSRGKPLVVAPTP